MRKAPGIFRASEMRVVGSQTERDLVHVGLAEQDRAGGVDPFHYEGIMLRHEIAKYPRTSGRADPGGMNHVFDGDGNSLQRPEVCSLCEHGIRPGRSSERGF